MNWRVATAVLLSALAFCARAGLPSGDFPSGAWALIADRFEMTDCTSGGPYEQVARRHAAHAGGLERMFERAEPWIAHIAAEIIERDLPGELALLPMVESGFDVFAYSRREAAGAWQLLEPTARHHGLVITPEYDARRDMLAATPVALNYLESLHHQLDQRWSHAIQAYNAGPTRVRRLLSEQDAGHARPGNERLDLPPETRAHFTRLMGLACLLEQPSRYGLELPDVPMKPGFAVIELKRPVELAAVAAAVRVDPRRLLELNAGLRSLTTPEDGPHRLLIPRQIESGMLAAIDGHESSVEPAAIESMRQVLERLQGELLPEHQHHHRVRPGDNLWVLSQRYSVAASAIRRSNGLGTSSRLRPGQLIRIPPGTPGLLPHQYRIQPGDSLWSIAHDHRMSVAELIEMNALAADTTLIPGRVLVVRNDSCCNDVFQALNP